MTRVLEDACQTVIRSADSEQSAIKLRCPVCKGNIAEELKCKSCNFLMIEKDGITLALPPDRLAYYSQFIADYEYIRAAEGRGSHDQDYYLALPYRDRTGNNSAQWKVRARSYDYLIRRIINSAANGEAVLDLGAGNCWLSFQLARRGYRAVAVDLLTNSQDGLGAAKYYRQNLGISVTCFQAELNSSSIPGGAV